MTVALSFSSAKLPESGTVCVVVAGDKLGPVGQAVDAAGCPSHRPVHRIVQHPGHRMMQCRFGGLQV